MVFIEWKLTTALGIVYKDLKRTPSYIIEPLTSNPNSGYSREPLLRRIEAKALPLLRVIYALTRYAA